MDGSSTGLMFFEQIIKSDEVEASVRMSALVCVPLSVSVCVRWAVCVCEGDQQQQQIDPPLFSPLNHTPHNLTNILLYLLSLTHTYNTLYTYIFNIHLCACRLRSTNSHSLFFTCKLLVDSYYELKRQKLKWMNGSTDFFNSYFGFIYFYWPKEIHHQRFRSWSGYLSYSLPQGKVRFGIDWISHLSP